MLIKMTKFENLDYFDSVMEHQKSFSSIWLQSYSIWNIFLEHLG